MRVINKKMVVVVLLIIEFTCGYLMYRSSKKEVDLAKVTYEEETNNSMFAMYVENEDTGEYDEVTNTNTFPEGYILNMDKTGCIDNKGNSISDILTSKDDKVMVKSNKTVFCYLYFDKDNRVYTQVKSDYKNNTGALLLSETESDEYPVYYYNGNITNNNILYANFCWKMVRTTETGGVKLIYNGVPDEAEDGTLTCDNTGEESQIGKSAFNSSSNSPAYVGYMYNTVYKSNGNVYTSNTNVYTNTRMYSSTLYYYGDEAEWNEETRKYDLKLSDGTDVTETTMWSTDLAGKYTCRNTTDTSCATVYYIAGGTSTHMYYYALTNNTKKDDYKIKLATSVMDNEDGTYTLVDPVNVSKADWYTTYSDYKNYYYCNDLTSEMCGVNDTMMYYSTSTSTTSLNGINRANVYKYGNSFTYENGTYKLVDIKEFWNWPENYNQINHHHYTCFNASGECEQVYYIYYTNDSYVYYITLGDGKDVTIALSEMLYSDDVNTTDSTIKDYIDTWYEGAILDKTDGNGVLHSLYLENTIFCNNRATTNLNSSGWNPNGGGTSTYLSFNSNSLECANKTDQFTLKVEAGGTEGYGNNTLDYPIGLISYKEASLASIRGYLKSESGYWTISPSIFSNLFVNANRLNSSSSMGVRDNVGVRPSVSLSNKVEITGGDGSVTVPYQIILSS